MTRLYWPAILIGAGLTLGTHIPTHTAQTLAIACGLLALVSALAELREYQRRPPDTPTKEH
jgi:hypothetical protein